MGLGSTPYSSVQGFYDHLRCPVLYITLHIVNPEGFDYVQRTRNLS